MFPPYVFSFLRVSVYGMADGMWVQELDKLRIAWSVGDILEDRPALSRWHPECTSPHTVLHALTRP